MRVQLIRRSADDEGAVAILVALLALVLFLMAAFAVDVGNGYAQRRQLSASADAAATAAATKLGSSLSSSFSCTSANITSAMRATAQTEAQRMADLNNKYGTTTLAPVTITCPDTSTLELSVTASRSVATIFGVVSGVSRMTPTGVATARFTRTTAGAGQLRPWAVCTDTATSASTYPTLTFATGIDQQLGVCGSTASGQWGAVDFDGGANSAGDLAKWTGNGYLGSITFPTMLSADPGVSGSSALMAAFPTMVGTNVAFPTVTGYTAASGGNNAQFPATGAIVVRVCGVQFGGTSNRWTDVGQSGSCWVNPDTPSAASVSVATTSGSTAITAAKNLFSKADVGKQVVVVGAGTPDKKGKATDLTTTLASVTNGRNAVLATAAGATVGTTTITIYPVPLDSKGAPIDHIQFQYVGTFSGGAPSSCGLGDTTCPATVRLWK